MAAGRVDSPRVTHLVFATEILALRALNDRSALSSSSKVPNFSTLWPLEGRVFLAGPNPTREYSAADMQRTGRGAHVGGMIASALLVFTAAPFATSWAGDADDLIQRGVELRRKARDAEAFELFKRAHAIDPTPRSSAQMGLAEQALGIWTDAEVHITAALERADDPWIKKNHVVLSKSLDVVASHLGTLEIWGSPKGAEIAIDGKTVAVLPLTTPLRVTAGTVPVTVRAKDFLAVTRVLDVPARGTARERFDLTRASIPVVPVTSSQPGEGEHGRPLLSLRSDPVPAEESSHPVWKRWWFWSAVGVAVMAGGATAYLLTRSRSDCGAGQMCSTIGPSP